VPRSDVTQEPDVQLQPRSPQPGQTPEEVVRAFVDAASSAEDRHAAARRYLTPAATRRWQDDAGVNVLAKTPYYRPEKSGELTIRGDLAGVVDLSGAYTSNPPSGQSYSYRVTLSRIDGQWRIANPPPGLVMTGSTFAQVYRRLNVYFLSRNESRVSPDPRWFSASRDVLPNLLLSKLLVGPSTGLSPAVTTELGDGVSLKSNVVPESDRLQVFLSGLAERSARAQAAASAQIVWTLSQLGATGVEIYDDGQLIVPEGVGRVQHRGDWQSYDPDGLPLSTQGYFVRQGAIWTTAGKAAPGPAGRDGGYRAQSVGVSADLGRLAVVGRLSRGVALYVGAARGELSQRLTASSLTAPSWDAAGGVWTVRNGSEIVQVPARGLPQRVRAQDLDPAERIGKLQLSRDGSRVALLVGPPGGQMLYIGAMSSGFAPTALRLVVPGLTNIVDVAWAAADSLVVLTRKGALDAGLWSVAVDGSSVESMTSSGLPGPPTAVAAAPDQPTLAISEGGLWRLPGPREWTAVLPRGSESADSAPAYPS